MNDDTARPFSSTEALRFGWRKTTTTFLVVDRKLDPVEALRESSRLTQGVKGQLLVFALLIAAVNLVGAIALLVGLLVTIPTTVIAAAYVLRRLQSRAAQQSQSSAQVSPLSPPQDAATTH